MMSKNRASTFSKKALRIVLLCVSGIIEDETSLRASALAFSMLLCAAPIGAMLLGLSSMFPQAVSFLPSIFEMIRPKILPGSIDQAVSALGAFSANAENLSLVSLAFSAVSALLLSMSIERCAQACWGIPASKDAANPLARHWLALTLTPCAIALLGFAIYEALSVAPGLAANGAPLAALGLFFFVCAWALPSGRPKAWIAAASAAMASLCCLAIQSGFSYAWSLSSSYGVIYGAAAAFVGAFLWVWLFWLSFLSSISICSTLFDDRRRFPEASGTSALFDFFGIREVQDSEPPSLSKGAQAKPFAPFIGSPAEEELILAASRDPEFADQEAFEAILHGRHGLAALREALGGACAARLARVILQKSLSQELLANTKTRDNIENHNLDDIAPPQIPRKLDDHDQ